jgi:filamentous hemagglutinin family protein
MINKQKSTGRVIVGLLFTPGWMSVGAQTLPITVDPASSGPLPVVSDSNGVPIVQIAPPSTGGISHNRYIDFNVGSAGAILNNSSDSSHTQLGGQIEGNPLLGGRPAAAILNQVTAANPSELRGMLEVAGRPAHVIVANPAGITCDGCGWLNASRATLTTGRPDIGPGGELSFDITSGTLRIDGAGLKGANIGQVDLLARALTLNAGVWADRLNVVTGAARVESESGHAEGITGNDPKPEVALDAAALGGMYANSIRLVGTEAGVGVNVGGHLAALTGDLTLTAAGDINIASQATLTAKGRLDVHTTAQVDIHAATLHGSEIAIAAHGLRNHEGGALSTKGSITLNIDGAVMNAARLTAEGDLHVNAQTVHNSRTGKLFTRKDISAHGRAEILNHGTVAAVGSATLRAHRIVNESDAIVTATRVALVAQEQLHNIEAHIGGEMVSLSSGGSIDLGAGATASSVHAARPRHRDGAPHVHAGNLTMQAGDDIRVQGVRIAVGRDASLYASRDIRLEGAALMHSDMAFAAGADHDVLAAPPAQFSPSDRNALAPLLPIQHLQTYKANAPSAGKLTLTAGRDVSISAGATGGGSSVGKREKETGLLWSTVRESTTSERWTAGLASAVIGQNVELVADQDVMISGSNVGARHDLSMTARRDVTMTSHAYQRETRHVEQESTTGVGALGRLSIGRSTRTHTHQITETRHRPSLIGSLEGSVSIVGGRGVDIQASRILAPEGAIDLLAQQVVVRYKPTQHHATVSTRHDQVGLAALVGTPMLAAYHVMSEMSASAEPASSRLTQVMSAGAAVLSADNAVAVMKEQHAVPNANFADYIGNIRTSLLCEASTHAAQSLTESTQAAGSLVASGGDVVIRATGDDARIHVMASTLSSARDLSLVSQGEIEVRGAGLDSQHTRAGGGSGGRIGVGASLSAAGPALGLHLGGNYDSNRGEELNTAVEHARIVAGRKLTALSVSDVTLHGGQLSAPRAQATVGGDLHIESLQAVNQVASESQKYAGNGVIGVALTGVVHLADNEVRGTFASVNNATGIQAGSEGFDVAVKGSTTLVGAIIDSDEQAQQHHRNRFTTQTLLADNIENFSEHKATARALGGVKFTLAGGGIAPSLGWGERGDKLTKYTPSVITGFTSTLPDENHPHPADAIAETEHVADMGQNITVRPEPGSLVRDWDAEKLRAEVAGEASVVAMLVQQVGLSYRVYTHDGAKPAAHPTQHLINAAARRAPLGAITYRRVAAQIRESDTRFQTVER